MATSQLAVVTDELLVAQGYPGCDNPDESELPYEVHASLMRRMLAVVDLDPDE